MKFKLSRKRKKQYKKDIARIGKTYKQMSNWNAYNWFYFREKEEVNVIFTIKNDPDTGSIDKDTGIWKRYDKPIVSNFTNEDLLEWYKENYPEDKLKTSLVQS